MLAGHLQKQEHKLLGQRLPMSPKYVFFPVAKRKVNLSAWIRLYQLCEPRGKKFCECLLTAHRPKCMHLKVHFPIAHHANICSIYNFICK